MKHSTDPALGALFDMIDDALKDREVCGSCLATMLLSGAAETLRCLEPDELETVRPQIDRVLAASVKAGCAH